MVEKLPQVQEVSAGSTQVVSISYKSHLRSGELLTGTPTVAEQTTSDLTLSNQAVSTAQLTILDQTVAIGEAVQFKITGQQAGTTYTIRVTVDTDSAPARTIVRDLDLICVN